MENKFKKPAYMLLFGMFILVLGGFFAVMHVGMSKLKAGNSFSYGFGSRAAPVEKHSYGEALKRGGEVLADRAGDFVSSILPGGGASAPSPAPSSAPNYASARAESYDSEAGGKDPFEDFYARNYGARSAASSSHYAPSGNIGSWRGSGTTMTSGGGASASEASSGGGADGEAPAGAGGGEEEAGEAPAGAIPGNPVFGGPAGRGGASAPPQLQASAAAGGQPFNGMERPGEMTGGQVFKAPPGGAGGKVSPMSGSKAPADLNGASEMASAGAQGSYNSKMSGGASAAAAAGAAAGGAVPAASKPAAVSADGSTGGGEGGEGGEGGDKAEARKKKEEAGEKKSASKRAPRKRPSRKTIVPPAPPFLKTVAAEKLNGKDSLYFKDEDASGALDKSLLASGAVAGASGEKRFVLDISSAPSDPEQFAQLSPERRTEIKKDFYVFVKQVEREYGAVNDAFYTSCGFARELCSEHGLTEGYVTLRTERGAKLLLGLKYVEGKWSPYTLGFVLPVPEGPVLPVEAEEVPADDYEEVPADDYEDDLTEETDYDDPDFIPEEG